MKSTDDASPRLYKRNGEMREGMLWPDGTQRFALAVEYNGGVFSGFQIQPKGVPTVQKYLQEALSKIADEAITIVCAGRTDAGVHATGQIIHFDTQSRRPERAWLYGVRSHLPKDIAIRWAQEVKPQFHARFSAHSRAYRYVISDAEIRPALLHDQITWSRKKLNVNLMEEAAQSLIGQHDFTSFRASFCNAQSPVRCIEHIHLVRLGELIVLEIKANAFLHHMVRNIVGALMEVGVKEKPVAWIAEVLAAKNRCAAGVTAPPFGLYLVAVDYPKQCNLPNVLPGPLFLQSPIGQLKNTI